MMSDLEKLQKRVRELRRSLDHVFGAALATILLLIVWGLLQPAINCGKGVL